MDGSQAESPQEGRGIILQGGPGSLIHDVAINLNDQNPDRYHVITRYGGWTRWERIPVIILENPQTARELTERPDIVWFVVRLWKPRDQVEDWLRRWVERGVRGEDWMRDRLRTWDLIQAAGHNGLDAHLILNLGEGQYTPDLAAQEIHRRFTESLLG